MVEGGDGPLNFVGGDQYNVKGHDNVVVVGDRAHRTRPADAPRKVILMLAANPQGTASLRLDEELRAIDHAIEAGTFRDRLEIRTATAVRTGDLQTALLRHQPTVVHFSGHGTRREGIVVTGEYGAPQTVPPHALHGLFAISGVSDRIGCVVLNACHTQEQATAIAVHVPCVVGMSHLVPDSTAISFAQSFYRGIAFGHSVRTAFELGLNSVQLSLLSGAEVPVLIAGPRVAESMILTA